MAVSKNAISKAGHLACLREMTRKTYLIYVLAIFHARHFKVHFSVPGSKGFRSKIKTKNLKVQSLERGENLISNLWKLFIYISNYYYLKRS